MRFTIKREELLKALNIASSGIYPIFIPHEIIAFTNKEAISLKYIYWK